MSIRILKTVLFVGMIGLSLAPASWAMAARPDPDAVIARVGDQTIRFSDIERMINSSTMIGVAIPPPGTAARNLMRVSVLDKVISANLLYLDALRLGMDANPVYQSDVQRFSDAMLSSLYRQRYLVGDIEVSDEEVLDYFRKNVEPGTAFTKDVGTSIQAKLRNRKFRDRTAGVRERLRKGTAVEIDNQALRPALDNGRKASDVVARIGDQAITWGEVAGALGSIADVGARHTALESLVDRRIMIDKARAAGLDQDAGYQAKVNEFRKVRLINIRRAALEQSLEPSEEQLRAYYAANRDRIAVPEQRKVQMVVLASEQQAREIKQKIESGELTAFEAAAKYSIDPNARKNLGEIGWVSKGTGFPALDELTFSLADDALGGPVETPAGWHLVRVLDRRPAAFQSLDDAKTRSRTRRMYLRERRGEYVADLRKHRFKVEVYQDVLEELMKDGAAELPEAAATQARSDAPVLEAKAPAGATHPSAASQ